MEQIQNHKSMDSQPIWLKSVRSEADWLDLTNPWLKEVINQIQSWSSTSFMGNCTLSLSSTCVGSPESSVDWCVSLISPPNWKVGSVQLQISIDGLSLSYSGLSPWDLRPPWAGSPVLCINKAQAASSKLVRVGLRSCFHCNTAIFCE